jgi:CRP/FNR family transcriptional regulator
VLYESRSYALHPGKLPEYLAAFGGDAEVLAILARRDTGLKAKAAKGAISFDLPLTREEMADYLGLTLETVSRQMNALKRDGVVELAERRRIVVPNFDRLAEETGDDSDGGFLS